MFENIIKFFKNIGKSNKEAGNSKDAAKERLHLVLMQDRANVSADFLDLMRQEIIEVIKKYIEVDESAIDVRLTNKENEDGTNGAPALYANIPILTIKSIKDKNKSFIKAENENKTKNEDINIEKSEEKNENINKDKDVDKSENTVKNNSNDNEQEDAKIAEIKDKKLNVNKDNDIEEQDGKKEEIQKEENKQEV